MKIVIPVTRVPNTLKKQSWNYHNEVIHNKYYDMSESGGDDTLEKEVKQYQKEKKHKKNTKT